ncbi:MAG TPA: lipocalin-like domain-containing protein [Bryobacteraceae bacterium]|jgi:predicted secreted hydrolase|nr:lipocalin-like domain-containing protein [Bryobacteraceae bacterium]
MKSSAALLVVLAGLACAQQWQIAQSGYRFEFPRDHFAHLDYQTEWWYYTGNLRGADGHRYGFELTFFRQGQHFSQQAARLEDSAWRPDQVYLAHLALSDIDGKNFYHVERLNRAGPGLAGASEGQSAYWNGNWQVKWISTAEGKQQLTAVCDRFVLDLTLTSRKGPVIQGKDGVSEKGPERGQASHYISLTRLAVSGRLTKGRAQQNVTGLAWMDHEFFTGPKTSDLAGWDWFSIQLQNGEELMLYRLRSKSGRPDAYSSGTYIDRQGRQRFLSAADFLLAPGDTWLSPHSGARYPLRWHIQVPSLQLDLQEKTELPDQELWTTAHVTPTYWEGAVSYTGTIHGQTVDGVGYLEMTGYQK